jgi:hypothetical protein
MTFGRLGKTKPGMQLSHFGSILDWQNRQNEPVLIDQVMSIIPAKEVRKEMRDNKIEEKKNLPATDDKARLAARIPIREWYDIERRMAIISRMSTEPAKESSQGVSS